MRWASSASTGRTEARSLSPRRRMTIRSGTRAGTRRASQASCLPWVVPLSPPPGSRAGSTTPQAVTPSLMQRLSEVAVPPAATSASTKVDFPTPAAPTSRGAPPAAAQTDACSGARPRVPAHHIAGYWRRAARARSTKRVRITVLARRLRAGGRQRYSKVAPVAEAAARRSKPVLRTSRMMTSPARCQAPRSSGSHPLVSWAASLALILTLTDAPVVDGSSSGPAAPRTSESTQPSSDSTSSRSPAVARPAFIPRPGGRRPRRQR